MDKIVIRGGLPLSGTIPIAGAKNAALPLMAASLLTDEPVVLANLPELADIKTMADLLSQHGVAVTPRRAGPGMPSHVLELSARDIISTTAPYELVRKMRASFLVLGPLVARCGEARVSLPGGDEIGVRPVDLHIKGLQRLGAEVELSGGYIEARAPHGLKGAEIAFPSVSVGATEHILMAAVLAEGESVLINAAREPEITDLATCLNAMGARIEGIGSDRLIVHGVPSLHGARHVVIPDRIETGTYIMAVAAAGGEVRLAGARLDHLEAVARVLEHADIRMNECAGGILVRRSTGRIDGVDVMTEPYPGFPTDMQAQIMALMTIADGAAMITETIFENRFMHVPELMRLGANINVQGPSALVRGVRRLAGAPVMATDLRASVSLVIAGLIAEGETVINGVHHLDRGYERLEEKLAACGARIERVRGGP
ncbi:MAG TPA: UDP-N-acetylglucosamine 1-carboxyvinyltransferase [Stellaceae bacterium]|jgi:UDP-N-acetylglucosamine 1-carboxyvinyltransferase|nr:UDP-N-acetylglucosamine 1-carboxyvinyltransferase [Stellaceae bacterium]